ncbi:cell wall hydrolase [Pelagibacterium luteolum]|uniref:Cell Wall Hydrolase n=1 Tax=Pelagibacterium luteolum TaxID=440168 RepID=A0A1G7TGB7_9HYPH|nr:cell wall hydrolase [Pelagibacterium luteolum]SDG34407.1 Cell Wall Hydrolase [Pelagibacterium luteolum]
MALSNDAKRILAQTLLGEAGGEGFEGMAAIAHVIRNRAGSGRYPSDPVAVALQPRQFSTWNSGEGGNNPGRYGPGAPGYEQAVRAVETVFEGNAPDPTGGATHYWAPRGMPGGRDPYWAGSEQGEAGRLRIGNHVFLPQQSPQTALAAANQMAGTPPPRPESLSAYAPQSSRASVPQLPPRLPQRDPRAASQQINAMAGAVPDAVLPRLNDANINERMIDTFGPDPQATSPTQAMWPEYSNWLEQSSPATPSSRGVPPAPPPNIPGMPSGRGRAQQAPAAPYPERVTASLNNVLSSQVMDPATDMGPFNNIIAQHQPAPIVPPLPQADPRPRLGYTPFPWPDDLPSGPTPPGIPSAVPVQQPAPVRIADLPPLPQGMPTSVATAPVPPQRPTGLAAAQPVHQQPTQTAALPQIAPVPPQRPPMATYAGATAGFNPIEQAGEFLGGFAANGGVLGVGLNALMGRGLFPGDAGVIPQFKQSIQDRMDEGADPISALFSRRVMPAPTFSTTQPEGRSVSATQVGPSGSRQGFLTASQKPRVGSGNYNASVRDANMAALRGVEGRTMREKIDNYQRSGGTLYRA